MIEISVVIPARNRAKTLPYCLESVLNQTCPAREVIVVDDNSSDETRLVVESFASRGVRYERLLDGKGAQAARNHGIRVATHDWIAFQDSDDIWLPDKLELQVGELESHGKSLDVLIHCAGVKRDADTGQASEMKDGVFEGACYEKLLLHPGPMYQGMVVNRAQLYAIGLLDVSCPSYQEWDTAIRLAKISKFVHIQRPLFEWVWHSGDAISKDYARDFEGFQYVLDKHRSEIIRLHSIRGWRVAKMTNVSRALRHGYYAEASHMLESEAFHSSTFLAKTFAKFEHFPPGGGRLLRHAAMLPF